MVRTNMTTNDVEKRWHDPAASRGISVCRIDHRPGRPFLRAVCGPRPRGAAWALGTPIVFGLGCIGAFIKTYRIWRTDGTWPIWHGAGWFLLTLMLVSLSIPGMVTIT